MRDACRNHHNVSEYSLKTGSQVVAVGDRVEQGQKLGNVGSSGSSTGPHLHYEVARPDGTIVDPFAGQCNAGAPGWRHRWGYNSSIVTRIATHATAPVFGASSRDQAEPVVQQSFSPGDTVYVAIYTRTYSVFVTAAGAIADHPAVNRIYVDFVDGTGIARGTASVAVRTQ